MEAALNYNENKVQKGKAVCLHASNYLKEAEEMNFYEKLIGFKRLHNLNERATTKTIHISLNFDPSEKLTNSKLIELANLYMERLGFGEQPFLIYKHEDAGHPHIHIVSTMIRNDGSRINTHNIGRNQSEKARKEIEKLYGLVKAENQHKPTTLSIQPADIEIATYGRHETKRAISTIVTTVFNQYKFTSLPEFNAALRQFNVVADRGNEGGRVYKNRGLIYRILDPEGNKIGVPIKASSIGCQPTLNNLERKFNLNEAAREPLKQRVKTAIDNSLPGDETMKAFVKELEQQNIYVVLRQNADIRLYGITFVDNQSKAVFNGSDLGKQYSIAGLQGRLATRNDLKSVEKKGANQDGHTDSLHREKKGLQQLQKPTISTQKGESILGAMLSTKEQYDNVPSTLINKKRKKKKRKDNNL